MATREEAKTVALHALRLVGRLRFDEVFEDEDDLHDQVTRWIADYMWREGVRFSDEELKQLEDEVLRQAKKRNNTLIENPEEPDDLEDTVIEAIDRTVDKVAPHVRVRNPRQESVANDPFGTSDNPADVNAALSAERRGLPAGFTRLGQNNKMPVSGATTSSNFNRPTDSTPKLSATPSVDPNDGAEQLDDRQRAAAEEKVRRQQARLADLEQKAKANPQSDYERLNLDQTYSLLDNTRKLRGRKAALDLTNNDPYGLLDSQGIDKFSAEQGLLKRPSAPTTQTPKPVNNRPTAEELQRMAVDPTAIDAYTKRRRTESNNPELPRRITDQEIQSALEGASPEIRAQVQGHLNRMRSGQMPATTTGGGANQPNTATPTPTQNQSTPKLVAPPRQYSQRKVECNPAVSKLCGGTCIPKDHECHEGAKKLERVTAQLEAVPQALKNAQALGTALGLPVTDPKKPMAMANAAAAFESQTRQVMPFLNEGVWKGMAKATNFMIRASVVSSAVVGAWAAFKNAGGAINPGFKRALDMAEQDAFSGIQKMAGAALRPLTDPFEARMARQESRVRSQLGGMAQQATAGLRGPGLRSAQTVSGVLASNQGTKWYSAAQRQLDNEYANDFDGWLKRSGMLATQPSKTAYEAIGQRRFAREYAGNISHADLSKESLIDIADRATRGFADDIGSRMARLGKDPDALKLSDFEALVPRKTLERFNPQTNAIDQSSNAVFRRAVAESMYNRYQIGRRPASQRRQELEGQLAKANDGAKAELVGLNQFIQGLTSLDPKAPRANRQAEGQQRERVILALARARGYKGDTTASAYGFLKERHAQLPKSRGDAQDRIDKRCGKSGIPDNRKCSKPTNNALPGDLELRTADMTGGAIVATRRQGLRAKALKTCQAIADAVVRMADKTDTQINELIDALIPQRFRDSAKRLVGRTKLGLTHFMLDRDNYELVDVDVANNGATYRSPDGTLTGLTSAGTKVVAMQTFSWGHSYSLNKPFYETAFTVNNTVDASRSGAKPNRREIVEMARNTEALFRRQVSLLEPESAIMVSAFGGDTKESSRAKLYQRIGFTPGLVGGTKSVEGTEMWTIIERGKLRPINNIEYQKIFGVPRADWMPRYDKKCGNSGIPDNAKCTKQTKAGAADPEASSTPKTGIVKTGAVLAAIGLAVGGAGLYGYKKLQDPETQKYLKERLMELNEKATQNDARINEEIDSKLPSQLRDPAKRLIGNSKLALAKWVMAGDATPIRIDPDNNAFTYKRSDGSMVGMTSVGTKVVTFFTKPAREQELLGKPTYEMAFTVNQTFDSEKTGKPNKREALQIAKQTARLFEHQLEELPDGAFVCNLPFKEDGKGAGRAKLYERFGFQPVKYGGQRLKNGKMWAVLEGGQLRKMTMGENKMVFNRAVMERTDSLDKALMMYVA